MGTQKTKDALQGHVDVKDAYRMAQNDIRVLCKLILEEARMQADYSRKAGLAWTHVGDLAEVRRALVEALAQFAQQDETFVWKRVAKMREGRK